MLFLAIKQLLSKKKQTLLILLGISFGTMLFISISGIMLGLREYISDALLNNTSHILIKGKENYVDSKKINELLSTEEGIINWIRPPIGKKDEAKINSYQSWIKIIQETPEVYGFTPRLTIPVILSKGDIEANVRITGTIPGEQVKISKIENYIKSGSFQDLTGGGNKIIIGQKMADDLGVAKGELINLFNKGSTFSFKIVGTFKFGDDNLDTSMAFASLGDVQTLNKTPGRISEIAVSLYNIEDADKIAQRWSKYGEDEVKNWKEANKMFMEMIKMQDAVRYFVTFSVLVVAGFGVYNVLTIMINQKRHEIAILKSIGYGKEKILRLILYQGLFLGISGGILGIIFGFSLTTIISNIDLSFEIGNSNHILISYAPSTYILALIAAIISSILASFLPAYNASKMTPIDIIRGQE